MLILPSIDLMNGQCVRLRQGDFSKQTTYNITPISMAEQFKREGATALHVVDLEGARSGKLMQLNSVTAIVAAFGDGVQVGGGVRSRDDVDALLACGVQRVVLGTHIVTHQADIPLWINAYGIGRLVFALDIRLKDNIPYIATSGWKDDSQETLWNILACLPDYSHVLCTDIGQDGMQQGPNFAIYQACIQQYPTLYFQASGGVSCLEDIQTLKRIGVHASIIGKALYENTLSLSEAITC